MKDYLEVYSKITFRMFNHSESYSAITGLGKGLPARRVDNAQFVHDFRISITPDEIESKTGIGIRYIADKSETTTSLAIKATREAMWQAGLEPAQIDSIVVASMSSDTSCPNMASQIQFAVRANHTISALDVNAACSGFVGALAKEETWRYRKSIGASVVVGTEIMSRVVNMRDRRNGILFGDGAGAVVLENAKGTVEPFFMTRTDGSKGDLIELESYAARTPMTADVATEGRYAFQMKGLEVYKWALAEMPHFFHDFLRSANLQLRDIDWVVFHQANGKMLRAIAEKAHIPPEKVILTVGEYGNTSAASIPMALHKSWQEGNLKYGDRLVMIGFGGGLIWTGGYMQFFNPHPVERLQVKKVFSLNNLGSMLAKIMH